MKLLLRITQEDGSNLVETAMVLPLYFLLLFTLFSFSIVFFAYCNATFASKVGLRYAIVHSASSSTPCTSAMITSVVTPYLYGAPSNVTITPVWSAANAVGTNVSITVTLTYSTGMPYGYLNNLVASTKATGVILH